MYQLYNGDCFEIMQQMIDNNIKVDAIICDPPYNIKQAEWDNNFDIQKAIELCSQLLKPNGNIIIFQGYSNVCFTKSIMDKHFIFQDWIIYDRIKGRGGKKHLVSTREDILWYSNGNDYIFNKIPSTIKKKTKGLGLKNGCEYRALSNVWTDISPLVPWSAERNGHPTQKPLQLMERIVTLFTNENDIVLDFCAGSGSTGEAALKLNRQFIGIEQDENWFNIMKERCDKYAI